jgi:hypothetical protein
MTTRTVGISLGALAALAATGALAACGGGGAATPPGGQTGSPDAGSSSGGQTDAHVDAGTGPSNGQLSVTMQNSGRHGDDVLLTVQGSDPAGKTTEAHVQMLDASNTPVLAFDTDWDGVADSAEQRVHFDQSTLGQKTFTQTITLAHAFKNAPSIASAVVSLSDASGALSPSVTAMLAAQPVRNAGDGCDPAAISDRCVEGLSCSGKTPTCVAGVAPSLTRVAYYGGNSPAELFLGADPDEDLATLEVDFLDSSGKPVIVDLSGDNTPASSVMLDARGVAGQTFFFENDPVPAFATAVPKISVKATDSLGRVGAPVVASLTTEPTVANGLSCDPYGFNVCATGSACSPGTPGGTNKCASLLPLQTTACGTAPQATTDGVLAAWGVVGGVSLWDPPAGCAAVTAVGRPESVVMLVLAHAVSTLTISTATPETDFDTILYVLPGCASATTQALGCSDDAQGFASTVTLTDVAAGSYAIVVDSAKPVGGHFGLSVIEQ